MSEQPEVERKPPLTDAELEALVHEHAKQRARRMAQAILDLDQSLNQDVPEEAQAKPIRRANGGAGNTVAPSNEVKPKPEHADAQTLLDAFIVELAEGEEFVVVNAREKRESFWKRNGRLENSEGKQSRGSIVKILTKGGKLVKKDSSVAPDVATPTDEPKSTDTTLDPNSDAAIAQRIEKQNQKQRVNSLFDELVEINTDESIALGEEAIKLLAELTIQADEAKVRAFEEKAQALLKIVVPTADQPLGTVDPVIRNLDGKGKEQKELFELHEGDTFERTVDGKTEGIRITRLDGDRVEVHLRTNFKDGSKSDETFGTTIGKFQKELREKEFTRGSKINFSESTRIDINLDALKAPDSMFDEALAFQPLGPGEQATYKGDRGLVTIERDGLSGLYWIIDEGADKGLAVYTEEDVRNNAGLEKWQRVETTEANPDLRGRDPRNYEELYEGDVWIKTLPDGSTRITIVSHDLSAYGPKVDVETTVMKGSDPGEMTVRSIPVAELQKELRNEGYSLDVAGSGPKIEVPKTSEEPKKPEDPVKSEPISEKERLDGLRTEVDLFRRAYVEMDHKQDTKWKKLKRFFGMNIGGERGDPDTESLRQRYEEVFTKLKEAELAAIDRKGLSQDEVKSEMVRLLNYFTLGERLKMKADRIQVEAQDKKWSGKITGKIEDLGKWYNGLSPKKKLIAGAIGLAAGGVAFATGGTAVGTAAAAGLFLKRMVTTAGAKVFADGALEQGEAWLTKHFTEKDNTKKLEELNALNTPLTSLGALSEKGISPEALGKLDSLLTQEIKSLDKKLQHQKRNEIWRKTGTWGLAIAGATYFSYRAGMSVWGDNGSAVRTEAIKTKELNEVLEKAKEKANAATVASPSEVSAAPASASSAPATPSPEQVPSARVVPATPEGGTRFESLRNDYKVTSADRKQGLWGVIKGRLPDNIKALPVADQNRVIANIEELMKRDLAGMTKEERLLAGFEEGNLDKIYADKTVIRFDQFKSLTDENIQAAQDGKLVGAPSATGIMEKGARVVAEAGKSMDVSARDLSPQELEAAMKGAEDEMIAQDRVKYEYMPEEQKALRLAEDQMIRDELAKDKMTTTLSGQSYDDAQKANTAKEFAASQVVETKATALSAFEQAPAEVKTQMMLRTTGNIRQALFLTPELMADTRMNAPFDYTINRGAMGFVQMGRITEKFAELHSGQFNRFNRMAFPLHPSQVDQVVRLVSLAQDSRFFGTAGLPKSVETVDEYTRRIAHLALSSGKEKELFMLLQGRRNSLI